MRKFLWSGILFSMLVFTIVVSADASTQLIEVQKQCKAVDAECDIDESGKICCDGLACVPFNQQSGNGKCSVVATSTPTVTPSTVEVSVTVTPTAAQCEPTIVIGDCTYNLVD